MSKQASYRTILRASAIMGGASVLNILFGMIRMKAAAVLLGPAGVGLIGLFQNILTTGTVFATLGLDTVGTRQIAHGMASDDQSRADVARHTLLWTATVFAICGALVLLAGAGVLSRWIFGNQDQAVNLRLLALGLALSVLVAAQLATLNGLRQIKSLAILKIASSAAATLLGVLALLLWAEGGILAFVLALPVATFLIGLVLLARLPKPQIPRAEFAVLARNGASMVRLGVAFMLGGLAMTLGQLLVRSAVQAEFGTATLGQFEAAWMISMTYLGFVLGAMVTDYYPRLSAIIQDKPASVTLVNQQTEVALYLVGPLLVAMMTFAPFVMRLLYSADFLPAAQILRWQILGDLLKAASWPLAFVMLAAGRGKTFVLAESFGVSVFVLAAWIGLPHLGVQATGAAFAMMYLAYLPCVYAIARHQIGFAFSRDAVKHFSVLAVILIGLATLSQFSDGAVMALGAVATGMLGWQSWRHLRRGSAQPRETIGG